MRWTEQRVWEELRQAGRTEQGYKPFMYPHGVAQQSAIGLTSTCTATPQVNQPFSAPNHPCPYLFGCLGSFCTFLDPNKCPHLMGWLPSDALVLLSSWGAAAAAAPTLC